MIAETTAVAEALEGLVAGLDPARYDGSQSVRLLKLFSRIKSIAAAAEGRVARRVDETNVWMRGGHRSAAHAMAVMTGTSVGQATSSLQTAERLEHLGRTAEAYAKGRLSPAQAAEIAHAASEVPDAEDELLLKVKDERFAPFRDRCRRIAASAHDPLERAKRINANRSCRTWTDAEGGWNLSARGTPADGGRIMAALGAEADAVFKAARARGDRDALDAYRFDALRNLITRDGAATGSGPKAHVHVNVDAEALLSLKGMPGATCEIPGLGAIPVEDARAMLGDALLTISRLTTSGGWTGGAARMSRRERVETRVEDPTARCAGAGARPAGGARAHHPADPERTRDHRRRRRAHLPLGALPRHPLRLHPRTPRRRPIPTPRPRRRRTRPALTGVAEGPRFGLLRSCVRR
jgi:hypothetical protein